MKNVQKKTLFGEMVRIVGLALLVTVCGILGLFIINQQEEEIYAEVVERNEITSCMHIVLGRMETQFERYAGGDREAAAEYEVQYEKLLYYIESLYQLSENRASTRETLDIVTEKLQIERQAYETAVVGGFQEKQNQAVISALEEMKVIVQLLVVDDLQITRDEFVVTLDRLVQRKLLLMIGICIVMAIVYGVILHKVWAMRASLDRVTKYAEQLSENKWNIEDIEDSQYHEFNILEDALDLLKNRTAAYYEQLNQQKQLEISLERERVASKQKDILLVETQLENLKRQINPHFLFNVLNIIGKTALLKQPEQAMLLLESISRILRYSLENENKRVSLEEDMSMVEDYLRLQKARYENALCYEIDMAPESQGLYICPMLLQPLVENCIKHGLEKIEKIDILVSSEVKDGWLVLQVEDDGPGFVVNEKHSRTDGSGIGLSNVRERLRLEYGQDSEITVDSMSGRGTAVRIRIRVEKCITAPEGQEELTEKEK